MEEPKEQSYTTSPGTFDANATQETKDRERIQGNTEEVRQWRDDVLQRHPPKQDELRELKELQELQRQEKQKGSQ